MIATLGPIDWAILSAVGWLLVAGLIFDIRHGPRWPTPTASPLPPPKDPSRSGLPIHFGLRTLLIAATGFCIVGGLLAAVLYRTFMGK
jgi:hypothetical protein